MKKNYLLGTTLFSLALIASSCTDTEDSIPTGGTPLQVAVSNDLLQSRAIVEGNTLPADAIMGVSVVAADGSTYPTGTYTNLKYTTTDGATFDTTDKPMLTSDEAKAVAYYPYSSTVSDMTVIPVTTAEQKDYMYSEWYSGLNESSPVAKFEMKHALAAIRINLQKSAGYATDASVTSVKAVSDAFHTSATLDATTGSLSARTGKADLQNASLNQALSTSPYAVDFLVVPGTSAAAITFTATIGGKEYIATTPAAVTLQQGAIHSFTLTLSAQDFSVTNTTVKPWTTLDKGSLTLEKNDLLVGTIDLTTAANGVYAVAQNGLGVNVEDADESCIAVAIIYTKQDFEQRLWIEKNGENNITSIKTAYTADGATNTDYTYFYWGGEIYDSWDESYLNKADIVWPFKGMNEEYIKNDLNIWELILGTALNDFNGKKNTEILLDMPDTDDYRTYANMGTWCNKFNETETENHGYSDWCIPALGQLALIYDNLDEVNQVLAAIKGKPLEKTEYWSSSIIATDRSQSMDLIDGYLIRNNKSEAKRVRFIREIESFDANNEYYFRIDENIYRTDKNMTWQQWINSSYNVDGFIIEDDYFMGEDIVKNKYGGYMTLYNGWSNPIVKPNEIIRTNRTYYTETAG